MLITFFLLLLAAGLLCLIFGVKYKRWLLSMGSTVLFMVLAWSGMTIEVASGGVILVFEDIVIVLVVWFFVFVGLMATLYGAVEYIKERKNEANKAAGYS